MRVPKRHVRQRRRDGHDDADDRHLLRAELALRRRPDEQQVDHVRLEVRPVLVRDDVRDQVEPGPRALRVEISIRGAREAFRRALREQVDDEDEHADRHVDDDGLGVDDQAAHEDRRARPPFRL